MKKTVLFILTLCTCICFSSFVFCQNTYSRKAADFKIIDCYNIDQFYDGVAIVTKKSSQGLIDAKGNFVIPYNKYVTIRKSEQGMVIASTKDDFYLINSLTGNIIYSSMMGFGFENPGEIKDGYLHISLSHQSLPQTFKFVNIKGDVINYDYIKKTPDGTFTSRGDFSEGLASVLYYETKTGKHLYGFSDYKGKIVIAPAYEEVYPFSQGLAVVAKRNDFNEKKYGCINKQGDIVIPFMYTNPPGSFHSGLAMVKPVKTNEFDFAYIDKKK